jgi:acyl-CoA synthetase (AMP-forming)/AMP-acid ligase II
MPSTIDATAPLGFVDNLSHFGERVALVTSDAVLSYGRLADLVRIEAARLGGEASDGVRRLVLLEPRNDVDSIVTYLAALSGGHVVLMNAPGSRTSTRRLQERYDPDVVAQAGEGGWSVEHRRAGTRHELNAELALLLSTSGTTGSPKLVRLSAANLQANAQDVAATLGIRPDDRAITSLPLHYCYGLSVLHSHLLTGASLVLTDSSVLEPGFWDLMRDHRVTSLAGVPYTFELLDRIGFPDLVLPDLRYVTQAGGRLPPERVAAYAALGRRRGWDFVVMYGQTEATARMAVLPPELVESHPQYAGRAMPSGHFRIDPVPGGADGVGELVYRGPNVMLGYAEEPADLARGRTITELRTGDLARMSDDGLVELVGRISSFVKITGLRVDVTQVEILLQSRGVIACVGGDDEFLDVAVQEPDDASAPTGAVFVRSLVREFTGLPLHAIRVAGLPQIPRLPSGKPDRAAARQAVAERSRAADRALALGSTAAISAIYADLLGHEPDKESSFVSLGGDSLSYVLASVRLEEHLGTLPPGWHVMSVAQLAGRITQDPPQRSRRIAWTETTLVLRATAIVVIVATHVDLITVRGGAHLLLGVAGFNFARFVLTLESPRRRLGRVASSLTRIVVPSLVWIAAMLLVTTDYRLPNLLMMNAFVGPDEWSRRWHFWFVEALLWILVATAALLSVPRVDRWQRAAPFTFALTLLGFGLLIRFGVIDVWTGPARGTPQHVFWLFALGWAAAEAQRARHRVLLTAVIAASVPGFFNNGVRDAVVAGGLLVLLWVPQLPIPRPALRVLGPLAASSLYIYLTHWQVYPWFAEQPWIALAASLAAGVLCWVCLERAVPLAVAAGRHLRPVRPKPPSTGPVPPAPALPGAAVLMKESV